MHSPSDINHYIWQEIGTTKHLAPENYMNNDSKIMEAGDAKTKVLLDIILTLVCLVFLIPLYIVAAGIALVVTLLTSFKVIKQPTQFWFDYGIGKWVFYGVGIIIGILIIYAVI